MFESQPKKQEDFLETPDISQRELLKKADGRETEEEIYVMPENFREKIAKGKIGKTKKKRFSIWVVLLIAVLILALGGGGFYFWAKSYIKKPAPSIPQPPFASPPTPTETEEKGEESAQTPEEPSQEIPAESAPISIKATIKSKEGEEISSLELNIPKGAYDPSLKPEFKVKEMPSSEIYNQGDYQVIVGPYQISPIDIPFSKPVKINVSYKEDAINGKWEEKILLGYFKDNFWSVLDANLDTEKNLLTIETDILPSEIFGIICRKSDLVPEEFQVGPKIEESLDSDKDGLTDVEERLYQTGQNNPDTDGDGVSDGQEIINLTDPTQTGDAKLATSSLIKIYSNSTHHWAIFYPASWLIKTVPETEERETLIVTDTGEFFSLTVEDNPSLLSLKEWYLAQAPGVDETKLSLTKVDGKEALWSPDRLTLYLGNEGKIYIFSYNLGTLEQANFKTTFQMMVNSFQFVKPATGEEEEGEEGEKEEGYLFSKTDLAFVGFDTNNFAQSTINIPLDTEGNKQVPAYETSIPQVIRIVVLHDQSASEVYDANVAIYSQGFGLLTLKENEYGDRSVKFGVPEEAKEKVRVLLVQEEDWVFLFEYKENDESKVKKLVKIGLGKN